MIYETISETKHYSLRKSVYLKILEDEFSEIKFLNFDKVNVRAIKAITKILRYFKNNFGEHIFDRLIKIEAVEESNPLAAFNRVFRRIKISLKLFGDNADEREVEKWVYPERIFIHELIHYLMWLPGEYNDRYNKLFHDLQEYIKENSYECRNCCPNLTLKNRRIDSIEMLSEEFICEVVSIYINRIIRNPEISVTDIFDKTRMRYYKVALEFYKKLGEIVKEKYNN